MTIERFLKSIIAYLGIYLLFILSKYLPTIGFYVSLGILMVGTAAVMISGVMARVNGPSYPSTVRSRISNGLRNGASKG
jgi:uncharacterized membrane protein